MERVSFSFNGIVRQGDVAYSPDGECMEMVNVQVRNGAAVPLPPPILSELYGSVYEQIWVHRPAGYDNRLCVPPDGDRVVAYVRKEESAPTPEMKGEVPVAEKCGGVRSVCFVGNVVCIVTHERLFYAVFKGGRYVYMGERPPFPEITFYAGDEKPVTTDTENGKYKMISYVFQEPRTHPDDPDTVVTTKNDLGGETIRTRYIPSLADSNGMSEAVTGAFARVAGKQESEGWFVHPVVLRYGLRMYTGDVVYLSPPVLVGEGMVNKLVCNANPQRADGNYTGSAKNKTILGFDFRPEMKGWKLKVKWNNIAELKRWSDIVTDIDIFVSPVLSSLNPERYTEFSYERCFNENKTSVVFRNFDFPLNVPEEEYIAKVAGNSAFYLLHSIALQRVNDTGEVEIGFDKMKNIEQRTPLEDDSLSHHTTGAGIACVYNSRLHLSDLTTRFYSGFPLPCFKSAPDEQGIEINGSVEVFLETEAGTSRVFNRFSGIRFAGLTPYLSYPDPRAVKMAIRLRVLRAGVSSDYYYETELRPSPMLNLAYSLPKTTRLTLSDFRAGTLPGGPAEVLFTEYVPGRIKVSEVDNPFSFPAKQVYTPSLSHVVAMCPNTVALSQGQFGQFPLYVFCGDGVYAMNVGTEGVAYVSVQPVSRDVCTYAGSVTPIDNAVVFATERGLMLLSGAEVRCLSDELEEVQPGTVPEAVLRAVKAAAAGIPENILYGYGADGSGEIRFRDYLKGAEVGYDYRAATLVVSNAAYPYSYLYGFTEGGWSKLTERFDGFVAAYPAAWAFRCDGVSTRVLDLQNDAVSVAQTVLVSRPVKFGSPVFKRLPHIVLRCMVRTGGYKLLLRGDALLLRGEELQLPHAAGFYVFGSRDGIHFSLVGKREVRHDVRNLGMRLVCRSYPYYIFVVAGRLRTDTFIDGISAEVTTAFDNRLR